MPRQTWSRTGWMIAALASGSWLLVLAYRVARSIWAVYAEPGTVEWAMAGGDITVSAPRGQFEFHPAMWFAIAVPLAILAAALRSLLRLSRRSWLAPAAWSIGLPMAIGLVLLLVRPVTASQLGKPLPRLEVDYLADHLDLAGRPLLVEFWATWCGPCIANIPHLSELQAQYRDRGLAVLGVSSEERAVVESFLRRKAMHYAIAVDPGGKLKASLGVRAVPRAFLVDRKGTIVWEGHPAELKPADIAAVLD